MVDRAMGPGSRAPRSPDEVDQLLRLVPHLAFLRELAPLVPDGLGTQPLRPKTVDTLADEAYMERVVAVLGELEQLADQHNDGGLRFLAVTLRHFLTEQKIAPSEHPLVVALFLRAAARRGDLPEHPAAVAKAMDQWQ